MMSLFCCKYTKNIVSRKITTYYFARDGVKIPLRAINYYNFRTCETSVNYIFINVQMLIMR